MKVCFVSTVMCFFTKVCIIAPDALRRQRKNMYGDNFKRTAINDRKWYGETCYVGCCVVEPGTRVIDEHFAALYSVIHVYYEWMVIYQICSFTNIHFLMVAWFVLLNKFASSKEPSAFVLKVELCLGSLSTDQNASNLESPSK